MKNYEPDVLTLETCLIIYGVLKIERSRKTIIDLRRLVWLGMLPKF